MVIHTCWVNVLWASTHSSLHSVFYDANFNISKRATFALACFSYEWILLTGCRGKGSWIIWLQGFSPSWWSVGEETLQKGVPESRECAQVPRWLEDSFSLICGAGSSMVRLAECSLKRYTKPVSKMRFSLPHYCWITWLHCDRLVATIALLFGFCLCPVFWWRLTVTWCDSGEALRGMEATGCTCTHLLLPSKQTPRPCLTTGPWAFTPCTKVHKFSSISGCPYECNAR